MHFNLSYIMWINIKAQDQNVLVYSVRGCMCSLFVPGYAFLYVYLYVVYYMYLAFVSVDVCLSAVRMHVLYTFSPRQRSLMENRVVMGLAVQVVL